MALSVERRIWPNVPWGLVGAVVLTALIGIYNLVSAAAKTSLFGMQALYLGLESSR